MRTLDLSGDWSLHGSNGDTIPATVPGCVHLDLLAAERIPDPFFRDEEKRVQWISRQEWIYARAFEVPAELLAEDRVLLRCQGLDSLATVFINGQPGGEADNMFRTWEFDVKALLREGENRIEIRFRPALSYTRERQEERYIHSWLSREDGAPYLRKEQCNFGWDWGPKLVTCGIWRPIAIVGWSTARIDDIVVSQDHRRDGDVTISVEVTLCGPAPVRWRPRGTAPALTLSVGIRFGEEVVATGIVSCGTTDSRRFDFRIPDPKLWFPNGLGAQPLYTVFVELQDADGVSLERWNRRIGLRTLRLDRRRDPWGESFQFTVNGAPFFAKGANWIPADVFAPRVSPQQYRHLLTTAADANMNMIRVWGGGIYEEEIFYDLCDELGLCVWQDFMFACGCYPTFDRDFMRNVEQEAREVVQRLRHHPSLALWCGNNELEQGLCGLVWTVHQMPWREYAKIFDRMLPDIVRELDPERDYWPGSPHNPGWKRKDCNNADSGDAHLWSVWHGREPFEWYRTSFHRFCSEFGFQSFPEPKTIEAFALPEDRNVSSHVMDHHQKSWVGNAAITSYMLSWYRQPGDFDSFVWMSQILQGMAMKYAVEHWRRQMPRCMGALYWQQNDTWPGPSWSSIDYFGRRKALHFMARRFFAPVLLSLVEKPEEKLVEVWISNDRRTEVEGQLVLVATDCEGRELQREETTAAAEALKSVLITRFRPDGGLEDSPEWGKLPPRPQMTPGGVPIAQATGPRDLLVWAELTVDGAIVSRNLATFVRPKHLPLRDPEIEVEIGGGGDGTFTVTLMAICPALHVWLELGGVDAVLSDNFFDLQAGVLYEVTVRPEVRMDREAFGKALKVRSLYDTERGAARKTLEGASAGPLSNGPDSTPEPARVVKT